jgi:hypothetical protein
MTSKDHEKRIAQLEQEVDKIRRKFDGLERQMPWWERIAGTFDKDPVYERAMKLGRKYRESLRPPSRLRD